MRGDQQETTMPGPAGARWWWRPRWLMADFRIPAPKITSPVYSKRLRAKCDAAISSGAVDAGTGALFDRQIDADLGNDQALIKDQARRYGQRTHRIVQRHRLREEKAAGRVAHVADDLTAEESKLGDLDKQIEERRNPPPNLPEGKMSERARRLRASLRNVGDSPFAGAFARLVLIALIVVDVPVLHTMLGRADYRSGGFTNWSIAAASAVALALAAGYACDLLLRWLEHRLEVHRFFSVVLYVCWAAGIGVATWFRFSRPDRSGPRVGITSGTPTGNAAGELAAGTVDVGMALLLSGLLLLTGAVAMGIVVLDHDPLQKERRRSARRRWRLRCLLRHADHVENRHHKAVKVQQSVLESIDGQATDAAKQAFFTSVSLKEDVRHWMANSLGDPAATSALMEHPQEEDPQAQGDRA